MKIGFSTLAMFMKDDRDIIRIAHKHNFDMLEILAEDVFFEKNNRDAYMNSGLDMRIHAATVDINIASLNKGIRRESVRQMIACGQYAERIGAKTITVHPGKVGRNDLRIRKYAIEKAVDSIGEIIDKTNVEVSVENMPNRKSFLASRVEELELIQENTGCHLTIDTGHANTADNLEEMLNLKKIAYCHIHDNDRQHDQHISLGEGTLDLNLLKKINYGVIELNNFDNVLKSKEVIEKIT